MKISNHEKNILMKFPLIKIFNENTLNKCCHGNSFLLSINRYTGKSKSSVIGLFVQWGDNKYIQLLLQKHASCLCNSLMLSCFLEEKNISLIWYTSIDRPKMELQ